MSLLSDALAAKDKATKGPWNRYQYDHGGSRIFNGNELIADTFEPKENGEVIFAAPAALDWIAKALPWIKETRCEIQQTIDNSSASLPAFIIGRDVLTALIEEAEGTEKEGENE